MCWTRAGSVDVEGGEHILLLSLEVLVGGQKGEGERGRAGTRQQKIRLSSEPQFAVFCFLPLMLYFSLPVPLNKIGAKIIFNFLVC